MSAKPISRRLQIVLAYDAGNGQMKNGRLTFGNIAAAATDEQLLSAAEGLVSLQERTLKEIVKVEATLLSR